MGSCLGITSLNRLGSVRDNEDVFRISFRVTNTLFPQFYRGVGIRAASTVN